MFSSFEKSERLPEDMKSARKHILFVVLHLETALACHGIKETEQLALHTAVAFKNIAVEV